MRLLSILGVLSLACATTAPSSVLKDRDFDTHDYFTVRIKKGASPEAVADTLGLQLRGPLGSLEDHYYFSARKDTHDAQRLLSTVQSRRRKRDVITERGLADVVWSAQSKLKPRMQKRDLASIPLNAREGLQTLERQLPAGQEEDQQVADRRRDVMKRLDIKDPIFGDQWHIMNSKEPGHDVNVTGVWLEGTTGKGATVCIVDDGIDMHSDDLKDNYLAEGSYDFNDHDDDPKPELSDDHHGTRCAGEIAAARNNVCGVGLAYDAKISGVRILSKAISDEDEALAINYKMDVNNIYSCSWGPPDDGRSMDAPSTIIKSAMLNAIQKGRFGLGNIFVYAAGNGAAAEDNCNFDGYTNSIYSITVGAIDRRGQHPYYSEKCSASLVVTYSSGSGDAIHTTDVGKNECYAGHGGTSAAAPLGAGIFALALAARPQLSWRDMQYLCVHTAVPVNEDDPDWQATSIGKKYSHTFGYGKLDAWALVSAAKAWTPVRKQAWYKSAWQHVAHAIPEGELGVASTLAVSAATLKQANLARLEHVTVTMNVEHQRRGDLSVALTSPHGMTSHLSATRRSDEATSGYADWTFMSVAHWGEPGVGNWTIVVKDSNANEKTGKFVDWRIILWGEAIDDAIQGLYPMPTDHDDDDHNRTDGAVSTASISAPSTAAGPTSLPTDHPERPVNEKPTTSGEPTTAGKPTTTGEPAASGEPTATGEPPATATTSPDEAASASVTATGFSGTSIWPHLPVSPRTQVWIAGAFVLILLFCVALGVYVFVVRRRRAAAERDYEFEVLPDEEGEEGKRGGQLWDAFAAGSDEEGEGEDEGVGEEEGLVRGYTDKEEEHR